MVPHYGDIGHQTCLLISFDDGGLWSAQLHFCVLFTPIKIKV